MLVDETFKLVLHAQSKGKKMENPRVCLSITVSIFVHEASGITHLAEKSSAN